MKKKKTLVLVLALLMVWSVLPLNQVVAAGSPNIELGTSKITKGNTVWFANYNGAPVHWRVMGDGNISGNYKLFLSDRLLDQKQYGTNNAWKGSEVQKWCKNFYYNTQTHTSAFSAGERTALVETSKEDAEYTGHSATFGTSKLENEHVFLLSAQEVEAVYFPGKDAAARDSRKAYGSWDLSFPTPWWLRSPRKSSTTNAGDVDRSGYVYHKIYNSTRGLRPAFNLDLDTVLFTSAAESGKVSGSPGADALTAVADTNTTEWKLTLKDSARSDFSVNKVSVSSMNLTFNYSGATPYNAGTAPNEYISAVIIGSNGAIKYYGHLEQPTSSSGTLTVDLSGVTLAAGDQLFVFSEQCNGDKQTDLASDLKEIPLTYAITNILTNITSNNTATERHMSDTTDYTATLTGDYSYALPENISVRVGGTELASGTDYSYDSTNGKLKIFAASIDGDIEIEAVGILKTYTVTYMDEDDNIVGSPQTVKHGDDAIPEDFPEKEGYTGVWDHNGKNITEDTVIRPIYTKKISVVDVRLNKKYTTLIVGESETLIATVYPADAYNQKVTWKSNNPIVATVNEDGVVRARFPGSAIITATTEDGGEIATCVVRVNLPIFPFPSFRN